jgi:hypothetical protein
VPEKIGPNLVPENHSRDVGRKSIAAGWYTRVSPAAMKPSENGAIVVAGRPMDKMSAGTRS